MYQPIGGCITCINQSEAVTCINQSEAVTCIIYPCMDIMFSLPEYKFVVYLYLFPIVLWLLSPGIIEHVHSSQTSVPPMARVVKLYFTTRSII